MELEKQERKIQALSEKELKRSKTVVDKLDRFSSQSVDFSTSSISPIESEASLQYSHPNLSNLCSDDSQQTGPVVFDLGDQQVNHAAQLS